MVAYSFRPQFVGPITVGLGLSFVNSFGVTPPTIRPKQQTIRAHGKRRHARPGDELQLYTGMRTKACRLIGRARCSEVQRIILWFTAGSVAAMVGGKLLTPPQDEGLRPDRRFQRPARDGSVLEPRERDARRRQVGGRADSLAADRRRGASPMSFGMTPRQSKCLAFIRTYVAEHEGESPSYDEIAAGLHLRSKSGVWRMIEALEARGFIRRMPGHARAIELVDVNSDSSIDAGTELALRTYCHGTGLARQAVVTDALREYFRAHPMPGAEL